jgi:mitochondrial fission protein ELM1
MQVLSRKYGIRWLLTTSRRTGREVETFLREALDPAIIEDAVFVSSNPKSVVLPYLGAAQIVFVTEDSRTMMGEALLSGRPLAILVPQKAHMDRKRLAAILAFREQVVRLKAVAMQDYAVHADVRSEYGEPMEKLARAARALELRLGL